MPEPPDARVRAALERGDARGVESMLTRRARLLHDAGDRTGGVVTGRADVADALIRVRRRADADVLPAEVNGGPGALIRSRGAIVAVLAFAVRRRRIETIWVTTAPDKLARWQHRAR